MSLVFKKTIGFVVILFIVGIAIDYSSVKVFTPKYFIAKTFGCIIAGVIYFFVMTYFSKKAK